MNFDTHRAGLLLHPTSLPSGTLADAERWLDFLQASGMQVWQMLPLGMPLGGLSPYQCASAFAVNPALFPLGHEIQPCPSALQLGPKWWVPRQSFVRTTPNPDPGYAAHHLSPGSCCPA